MVNTRATKGTGSIREYSKGRFKAIITTGYELNAATGKKKRLTKTFTGKTRQEVLHKLQEFQYKSNIGVINPLSPSTTVSQFLSRWEKIKGAQIKESTLIAEKCRLEKTLCKAYGDKAIKDITPTMLNDLFITLLSKYKNSTVHIAKVIISDFFNCARKEKLIVVNPCQDTIKIKKDSEFKTEAIQPLSIEQVKQYLKYLHELKDSSIYPYTYELIRTAIETGARKGELRGLRFSDLNEDKGTISISRTISSMSSSDSVPTTPKSKSSIRTVSVGKDLIKLLMNIEHSEPDSYVFHKTHGQEKTPIPPVLANKILTKTLIASGVAPTIAKTFRFHDLRHTNATILITSGVDIKTVSKRLGHASVIITLDTYAHFIPETDKAASSLINNICSM
jgi:integrase